MKLLNRILTVVSIFFALFVIWNTCDADEDPVATVGGTRFNEGTIAPAFILDSLLGDTVKLEDFRGKVVLLDFWATW